MFDENYKISNNKKGLIHSKIHFHEIFIYSETIVNPPMTTDSLNRIRNITAPTVDERIFKV
jgi:hypothetical protein